MDAIRFASRVFLSALVTAGCVTSVANAQTIYNNGSGTNNGYYYVLYSSGGSATMTFPQASKYPGNFQIVWTNVNEMVGGKGWIMGSGQTIGYSVSYLTGYNNVSVYGWTTNPLVEYYICEFGTVVAGTYKGSFSSDGHTYSTYEHQQVNQPSILGTATYEQYLDNWGGSSIGSNHAVTTVNHYNHWKNIGMPVGTYNELLFVGEAYGDATGEINATIW